MFYVFRTHVKDVCVSDSVCVCVCAIQRVYVYIILSGGSFLINEPADKIMSHILMYPNACAVV